MRVEMSHVFEVLERTPGALRSLLGGLSDDWTLPNEGPETFSPHDVVGHLIHGEKTDWIPRVCVILQHGPSKPFEPFDRFGFRAYATGVPIDALLDEFARLRAENLAILRGLGLNPDQLAREGTHPALGTVTLGQLIATWVVHDLNHLAQATRVMAGQYRDQVGPWTRFLGILSR
ncbi:MAG TPA: DinB family protein [Vicinamibacteria bacterium]|nr:DinB family protein [Vicinamibacteria bacterium]